VRTGRVDYTEALEAYGASAVGGQERTCLVGAAMPQAPGHPTGKLKVRRRSENEFSREAAHWTHCICAERRRQRLVLHGAVGTLR